jgi:hypothetical protein
MQVEDDGEVEPALLCPDIGDITRPFTVGPIGGKITVEPVRRDAQAMVATLCLRVRTGLIPLIRISRPTRRSPTSRPASLSSIVILGRP